jgi:nitrate reductase molybdenum cofactor assembly chaperone
VNRFVETLAPLFAYPEQDFARRLEECLATVDPASPLAEPVVEFAADVRRLSLTELEELYTQTFDHNPSATLDTGWHLFGEDYARGEFLVFMRQTLRRYGVPESCELPDHLTHVLAALARMEEEEAIEFRCRYFQPTIAKLIKGLAGCPVYGKLARALEMLQ